MLSIDEIKNISFRKANFGGYRPEDVDNFIDQVLITMEQLRKEKSDLIKKMDILATRVEEYRSDEDAVRNALLSAQRVADTTVKEARTKAAKILEEAENIAKAKLYDLNVQIKQQKKQYALLLAEYNHTRDDIINHCNKHIALLKEIPSEDRIRLMEKSINDRFPTEKNDAFERAEEIAAPAVSEKNVPELKEETALEIETPVTSQATTDVVSVEDTADSYEDINLVNDLSSIDVKPYQRKNDNSFTSLKFGDDEDSDDENGEADSDKL